MATLVLAQAAEEAAGERVGLETIYATCGGYQAILGQSIHFEDRRAFHRSQPRRNKRPPARGWPRQHPRLIAIENR